MQSYEAARKAGKIQDFVVVFPENMGVRSGGTVPRKNDLKPISSRNSFLISKKIRPYPGSWQRTIMGFSMGAAGSIYWGAKHLDIFSTAVALDAGGGYQFYRSTGPQLCT